MLPCSPEDISPLLSEVRQSAIVVAADVLLQPALDHVVIYTRVTGIHDDGFAAAVSVLANPRHTNWLLLSCQVAQLHDVRAPPRRHHLEPLPASRPVATT